MGELKGKYSSDALWSSPFFKVYTDFTNDIDLIADGGSPCRRIRAITAGDVALAPAGDPSAPATVTYLLGDEDSVQATKILKSSSGTTVTKLAVYW